MNDMIPLSPKTTSSGCSSSSSSSFHQSSSTSSSSPCRPPRRINITKYFPRYREPLKSPLIVSRISTPYRTYSNIDAGHVKRDMGFGRSALPRRRSRRLRSLLVAITLTIALITGATLYDRISAQESLKWGLDLVVQSADLDPKALLGSEARGRFGVKGKAAQALLVEDQGVEWEGHSVEVSEVDSVAPLDMTGQESDPASLIPSKQSGEFDIPEQATLPRRANANREVYEIPEEERWSLVKGLRRLAERMPRRYKADKGMKETRAWNISRYKRLHNCLLTSLGEEYLAQTSYLEYYAAGDVVPDEKLRSLGSCNKEELNVVVGGTFHFGARHFGRVSGEDIWARSTIDSYETLGYTFLYAFEIIESMEINLEIPSLVHTVMAEAGHIKDCVNWGVPGKEKKLSAQDIKLGSKVVRWEVENFETGKVMMLSNAEWKEKGWDFDDPEFNETYRAVPFGFTWMFGQIFSDKPGKLDKASPDYEPHENWRCVKSEAFEEGLPIWKMFAWHFWESPAHPLGHQFTLAPEDYARYPSLQGKENNLFIGYSIESYCADVQPESDRLRRAYILAKHPSYFEPPTYKYSADMFERIKGSSEIDFVAGSGEQGQILPDRGIDNMGMLPSDRFVQELGKSRALVGIGKPIVSPTPYDALCMGVSFINPVMKWSSDAPEDRSSWTWQHEGLANIEPPHVYTVKHGDEPALQQAVWQAVNTPIDRFIPPTMSTRANDARHRAIVDIDWRAVAASKPLPEDLAKSSATICPYELLHHRTMTPSSSRTTSPPYSRPYRLPSPSHHERSERDRRPRRSNLSIEQALADSETAAAVAALTAVQSQGFSRSEERAHSPAKDRSRAPSSERSTMDGQHNQYQYSEQGRSDMETSGVALGEADAWGQVPPFQYGSPLNSLEDIPNYNKAYQGLPDYGMPGQASGSSMEEPGKVKKRRIDSGGIPGRSQDHLHQFHPHSNYQSSSNSTPQTQHQQMQQRSMFGDSGIGNSGNEAGKSNSHSYDAEDSDPSDPNDPKRRKVQRACDLCRRKKIRCDGAHSSRRNQKCSNCVESKTDCTYVEAAKRRGPPLGYIETLEWKVSKLEALAQRLKPSIDLTSEVGPMISRDSFDLDMFKMALSSLDIPYTPPSSRSKGSRGTVSKDVNSQRDRKNVKNGHDTPDVSRSNADGTVGMPMAPESWEEVKAACKQHMQISVMGSGNQDPSVKTPDMHWPTPEGPKTISAPTPTKEEEKAHDLKEEAETQKFVDQLNGPNPSEGYRYLGKSSGVQFLRSAMDYKAAMAGEPARAAVDSRRLRYWALPIWEATTSQHNNQAVDLSRWPNPELAQVLIEAYFEHDNITLPLLNRIIFQKDYNSGRWRKDTDFAKVCLLVFAVASRHVDHPDVYWHAGDEAAGRAARADMEMYRHSAGWRWMEAVVKTGKSILKPATLEDLQVLTLCAVFAMRSAVFSTVWAVTGMGLKSAIDIGMHTRVGLQRCTSIGEGELYKRAFWALVTLDRQSCAAMGRTLSLRDEDFDVDYPLDVDDEYWDTGNPQTDFVQPAGKTSRISMFISTLQLGRITAFAIMNVYTVNKAARGKDAENPEYQKKLIADLDSDLYAWLDSVPPQLKWDPERKDPIFFQQSAVLYANYYFVQILIHRPFIPTSRTAPSVAALALPSLAICTNAARACARIVNTSCQRDLIQHHMCMPAFTAAIVLLIGVWGGNKLGVGSAGDKTSTLEDVRSCLRCLKTTERWWRGAGRMRDILMELANWSDTSIDTPTPGPSAEQYRGRAMMGYRTEPSSQHSSPQAMTGGQLATQAKSDIGPDFASGGDPKSAAATRHMSQPPMSTGSFTGEPTYVPEDVTLPWWFVSRENGFQGLEGAVSHPMMASGSNFGNGASANQNLNGMDYLPEMFGGMPPPQNSFGKVPLGPNVNQVMQGNRYPPMAAFGPETSGSMNPGFGNMPPPATGTTPAPNVSNEFWSMQDSNALEMSGVLADIWSMAPSTFEMDQWSLYLSQPQPADGTTNAPQGFPQEPFFG